MTNEDDRHVGYRKPPKHTQFKKGQSGNPSGVSARPRTMLGALQAQLDSPVGTCGKGRSRKLRKLDAIACSVVDKAAEGDPRLIQTLLREMRQKHDETNAELEELKARMRGGRERIRQKVEKLRAQMNAEIEGAASASRDADREL